MKSILILLAGFCMLDPAFAQTASFSTHDPLGRLVYVKDSGGKHYLGYFCLERSKAPEDNNKCLQAQFGMGEDVVLGVDFLGNPSVSQGSWKPVGAVFSPESGKAFYHAALESEKKATFLEVWQNIWTREGYNWSSKPTLIKKSQWTDFLSLLDEKPSTNLNGTEFMSNKAMKGLLHNSYWNLAPWYGRLAFRYESGFKICINVWTDSDYQSLPNYDSNSSRKLGPCFSEKEKTLTYNASAQAFTATGVDGNPIVVSVIQKNGLVTLTLDMTMPVGSTYYINGNNRSHYRDSIQVRLNLVRQ